MSRIDTKRLLEILLNDLDMFAEAKDCLGAFDGYAWARCQDADPVRFMELLDKGNEFTLSTEELDEFMELVDPFGMVHPYYAVYMGNKYLTQD